VTQTPLDNGPETLPTVRNLGSSRRSHRLRQVGVAVLALWCVAGATGYLGVHSSTRTASGADGWHASFTYPAVARAGLDVPERLVITKDGGFTSDSITVAINGSYFDMFETQGLWPEPSAETRGRDDVYLTFDAPAGDTLTIDYDAYIQPASQIGRQARIAVVTDGQTRVSLQAKTFLFP
jgi:hypothetical protein